MAAWSSVGVSGYGCMYDFPGLWDICCRQGQGSAVYQLIPGLVLFRKHMEGAWL